jgi:hypothetical protein
LRGFRDYQLIFVNAAAPQASIVTLLKTKSEAQAMTQTDEYARARERAKAKYGFFVHAGVYAAVMALLAFVNLMNSPQMIWFVWPLIGWGLAVVLHGVRVFLLAEKNAVIEKLTEHELRRSSAGETDGEQ